MRERKKKKESVKEKTKREKEEGQDFGGECKSKKELERGEILKMKSQK